jgi:hypothetical protein
MPSSSQNSRKGELSNCHPLSDIKALGIPNLHMIALHTNPLMFFSVIVASGSASTHFVK